jgi:hypothetical protein
MLPHKKKKKIIGEREIENGIIVGRKKKSHFNHISYTILSFPCMPSIFYVSTNNLSISRSVPSLSEHSSALNTKFSGILTSYGCKIYLSEE